MPRDVWLRPSEAIRCKEAAKGRFPAIAASPLGQAKQAQLLFSRLRPISGERLPEYYFGFAFSPSATSRRMASEREAAP